MSTLPLTPLLPAAFLDQTFSLSSIWRSLRFKHSLLPVVEEKSRTRGGQAAALRINLNVQDCGIVAAPVHAPSRAPLRLPLLISMMMMIIIKRLNVCVFYYCRTYYKAVRVGGGGEWRTCAMRDDEPRPVWMSLPITLKEPCLLEVALKSVCS